MVGTNFIKKTAPAALTARLSLRSKSSHGSVKGGMLTSYIQVVTHLLEIYVAYDIIAKADTETVHFTQSIIMSPLQYTNAIWMKTLHCPQACDEYSLKGSFVEGLPCLIIHSTCSFCSNNKQAAVQKFAYQTASLKIYWRELEEWIRQTVILPPAVIS